MTMSNSSNVGDDPWVYQAITPCSKPRNFEKLSDPRLQSEGTAVRNIQHPLNHLYTSDVLTTWSSIQHQPPHRKPYVYV